MEQVKTPVRPYQYILNKNTNGKYANRILIGTATTGLIRMEWHLARQAQIVPMNWSNVVMTQFLGPWSPTLVPLGYMVAEAQNLIVQHCIDLDMEWLFLHEHDVLLPPDTFLRLNKYIRDEKTPVVSGLYYNRSRPSDPLVFRGRGTGVYDRWQPGDLVWCDGVPTGCLLIHAAILREMWQDSPEYLVNNQRVRRVFEAPMESWSDPETTNYWGKVGTSDLNWCSKVMESGYFAKAGWSEYQDREFPFLIDTNIFCKHINPDGEQFP
jgi:hypothetical protein